MHENKQRTFTRRQALENARFLAALARSGNARLAARELGVHRSTFTKRRARSQAFAAEWDGALAAAHARLNNPPRHGGTEGLPQAERDRPQGGGGGSRLTQRQRSSAAAPGPYLVRLANGRLQLRASQTRRIDDGARQAFLAALSATANVRLSARAAGFAREMRLALQTGYDRIELALIESFDPESYRDDAWRSNEEPAIPPMTAAQAIQLLYLRQKEARLWEERPDRRRRRGEDSSTYSARLARKWRDELAAERDDDDLVRALQQAGPVPPHLEPPRPVLPALEQVTGWSKACPEPVEGADLAKTPHHPDVALFGGWRLEDWEGRG